MCGNDCERRRGEVQKGNARFVSQLLQRRHAPSPIHGHHNPLNEVVQENVMRMIHVHPQENERPMMVA